MHTVPICLLLVISGSVLKVSDGCGKNPNFKPVDIVTRSPKTRKTDPTNSTTANTTSTPPQTTTSSFNIPIPHYLTSCNETDRRIVACQNGGTCLWMVLHTVSYICLCPKRFTGKKCELWATPTFIESSFFIPTIVSVILGIALIIAVSLLALHLHRRAKNNRQRQDPSNGSARNTEELKPMYEGTANDEKLYEKDSEDDHLYDFPESREATV